MSVPPVRHIGPARLTAGLNRLPRLDFATHRNVHGPLPPLSVEDLVVLTTEIKLTGRGGAGFPFATKLRAVAQQAARRRAECHVVVNATEGEPGSWKDKMLLSRVPHLILDGALLAAHALGARSITIGVAEGGAGADYLSRALAERRMAVPTKVVVQPERFISGRAARWSTASTGAPRSRRAARCSPPRAAWTAGPRCCPTRRRSRSSRSPRASARPGTPRSASRRSPAPFCCPSAARPRSRPSSRCPPAYASWTCCGCAAG
ncbi:hypothetical protein ACFQX7_12060 [Luedemannella flava]